MQHHDDFFALQRQHSKHDTHRLDVKKYMLLICFGWLDKLLAGCLQGRWARYEHELERVQSTQSGLSMEQGKASKRQIFSG